VEIQKLAEEVDVAWSEEEFSTAEFGDKRLKKRLVKIVVGAIKQPLATINQASEDWASSKAAYRFFDNKKVSEQAVHAPHQAQRLAFYHINAVEP
jgi:hypothetical protein